MLMNPDNHISLLDKFSSKTQELKKEYRNLYNGYLEKVKILKKQQSNEQQWAQRLDMLQFQVQEINEASLILGEDVELENKKQKLENFQTIRDTLSQSYELLSGEAIDFLGHLGDTVEGMQRIENLSEDLHNISENLSSSFICFRMLRVTSQMNWILWNGMKMNLIKSINGLT